VRWNSQVVNQPGAADAQAASLVTGEPTTPLAEHNSFAHNQAAALCGAGARGRAARRHRRPTAFRTARN